MKTHGTDWRLLVVLFTIAGVVESLAYGHFGAFTPLFLQELNVPAQDIPFWTGILGAAGFVIGIPLLPFWVVWAERYGRKLIIIRSAYVGALLFAIAGMSQNVWMLLFARFLVGFVLGNTGIMMAMQADATPRARIGTVVGIVSAGSPLGVAIGPFFGSLIVEAYSIRTLLLIDAALTAVLAVVLTLLLREPRRERGPTQSVGAMLRQSYRSIMGTPILFWLFVTYFLSGLGMMLSQPYVPLMVDLLYDGPALARTIGIILTVAGLAQAIATPSWGGFGDRFGHLRVLTLCIVLTSLALAGQGLAGSIPSFFGWRLLYGIVQGAIGALTMALIALRVPDEQRSAVLTISFLPLQLSWFLGPVLGAVLSRLGVPFLFLVAALLVLAGSIPASLLLRNERRVQVGHSQ